MGKWAIKKTGEANFRTAKYSFQQKSIYFKIIANNFKRNKRIK